MLAAVAFLAAWLLKINVFNFLSMEPKDTILAITGLLFGPVPALLTAVTVSFAEMLFISTTGWIGFIMNIHSSGTFVLTASAIYKQHRTLKGAILGLCAGTVLMALVMLLWNYLITPLYMNMTREAVKAYLPTVFLPFNLVKGALNTGLTMLLYKPLVRALKKANLLPEEHRDRGQREKRSTIWVIGISAVILLVCVILIFKWH